MSHSTALQVMRLVTKDSLNLRVVSKSVRSLKNSSKYEMDHCIHISNSNCESTITCV